GRMTGIFLVAGASELIFLLAPYTSRAGAVWTDVIWCAPYLFATVIAGTWNREEESVPRTVSSRFRTIVVSQVLPILIPLLVLFMGRRIAVEQVTTAWIAITAEAGLSLDHGTSSLCSSQQYHSGLSFLISYTRTH